MPSGNLFRFVSSLRIVRSQCAASSSCRCSSYGDSVHTNTTRTPAARAICGNSGGMKNPEMSSSTCGRFVINSAYRPWTATRIASSGSSGHGALNSPAPAGSTTDWKNVNRSPRL